jgi:S1-C subfamily serine protease
MAEAKLRFVCNGERPEPPVPESSRNQPVTNTRKPEFFLIEPRPDESVSKLSPADIFKTVKSSVWIMISFDLKSGKPDFDRGKQGSAIAIGPTTLLTNCHTLAGYSSHGIVQTETNRAVPVEIKKADYAGDRCVLEASSRLPSYVQIKPYGATNIGEEAYSIGAPRGLELTIANGIVSAKRNIEGVRYLQTTAPISPGSSGGGLFDRNGMLIGITTSFRGDGQNLNFAIAADAF